ncbi:MAG: U32 family peptidase [Acholeplasmataceae bacterium]|nr:MAG: U32 family peptidase [Acholeplasmataceae bacterium]
MVELLAPAGDLEKLKIALLYGADAVYVGGQSFSLRARASNFSLDDIKAGVRFAHDLGKKVYVTTNIIPHEEDVEGLVPYLQALEACQVDGLIAASPHIIEQAMAHTRLEIHLSTQQSVTNHETVRFWQDRGVTRIVLARELDKQQIKALAQAVDVDLEVFIHGGMCMSYSGRCSLSDNLTDRDANRGGCAHSCRWHYAFLADGKPVFDTPFSMSSKDLAALRQIPDLIDAGVTALKIEGRMKSIHYIATVVSTYRRLIDQYLQTRSIDDMSPFVSELHKAENRLTAEGWLEGEPGIEGQLFNMRSEQPTGLFIGLVRTYDAVFGEAVIEQRNHFVLGDEIEVLEPDGSIKHFVLEAMEDEDGIAIDTARHARQIVRMRPPFPVSPYALLRRRT